MIRRMRERMRDRMERQASFRDLSKSEIVRYQGISVAALARIWADIKSGATAPGVRLVVLTSADLEGHDRASGEKVSLEGRTARLIQDPAEDDEPIDAAAGESRALRGVVAYVEGEVAFSAADAQEKPRTAWTIEDVCEHVVLPAAQSNGGCFWLDLLPDADVGRQFRGAFVSQARQCRFGDLAEAVLEHYAGKDLSKQYVWLDIFSANQPRLSGADNESPQLLAQRYNLLTKHLHAAIEHFDERLVFFDSWLAPRALQRMWCVWEVYGAVRSRKPLELIFAPDQDDAFVEQVRRDPHAIPSALARFEMRDAQCHSASDQAMITEAVTALPGGFAALNGAVLERLRAWLSLTAKQIVERRAADADADPLETARLTHCVGQLAFLLGDMTTAEHMFNQALREKRRILGDSHKDVATSMHEVASVLEQQGRIDEALAMFTDCLRVKEELFGAEALSTAVTMQSLAAVLETKGELDRAMELLEKVLVIKRRELGDDHEQVAVAMHQLAQVLQAKGELAPALEMFRAALAIKEPLQGPKHPSVVTTKYGIAQVLRSMGELEEALALFEETALMYREQLGEAHANVGTTLHEIANIKVAQGDTDGALALFREALDIKKASLGARHPNVAATMHEMAMQLKGSDSAEALRMLLEAAQIKRESLGPKHEQVAVTLHEAALVHRARGELPEAVKLLQEAVAIKQSALGKNHAQVAITLHELGAALMANDDAAAAAKVLQRALAIKQSVYGPRSLQTAYTAHEAGLALFRRGAVDAAMRVMRQAFDIKVAELGPDHLQTAITEFELAVMLASKPATRQEALARYKHVLAVYEKELGPENGSTMHTRARVAELEE